MYNKQIYYKISIEAAQIQMTPYANGESMHIAVLL